MSGHSRWSQIRHKKALSDQKRGKIFSKLSRVITLAARKGSDPQANPSLASAIEQARAVNMPNDNIERAIKKVSEKGSEQLSEIIIEAIGPGGVALRIKGVTDNKNRTISDVRNILSDHGAKMVSPGSISWMFQQSVPPPDDPATQQQIEKLFEALEDHDDIEDVETNTQDVL